VGLFAFGGVGVSVCVWGQGLSMMEVLTSSMRKTLTCLTEAINPDMDVLVLIDIWFSSMLGGTFGNGAAFTYEVREVTPAVRVTCRLGAC
jgi:hypothetical protein